MTERTVPFFNYSALAGESEAELVDIFRDVIRRGAYILQKDLEEFEQAGAQFAGIKHCIGVADGTNALILCLHAAGIGVGDEVIMPSHTYVASAASVHFLGATPVLIECGSDHLIDIDCIEPAITPNTKAIMPVHLNGRICDMHRIQEIAASHSLEIIEDGAQSFGAKYHGKPSGSIGRAATISFYPAKVLGCFGDGGAILTEDDEFAKKIRLLRDHGRDDSGEVVCWGTNCRLDNLQAAILLFKLKQFPREIERRRSIAAQYEESLHDVPQVKLPPSPEESSTNFDIYQNYEIQANQRNELQQYLGEKGVRSLVQWGGKAVHQIEGLNFDCHLPRTDQLFERCLMLPMNTFISDEDVHYVISCIREFYESR